MRLIIKGGNNVEISEIGSIINRETALKPMGFGQLSMEKRDVVNYREEKKPLKSLSCG